MSEVNLQFTVNSYSTTFEVGSTELSFNPTGTNLSIYTGLTALAPGGSSKNTQVIYNSGGILDSSTYFSYNAQTGVLYVPQIYVESIESFGNLYIGNVISNGSFTVAGNITVGNLNIANSANLGNVLNLRIFGGTDGQYLKTNGNGVVTFQTLAALGPNGTLQYNNANVIDGIPGVTYINGNLNLGSSDSVKLTGGENSYVLQTDGTGNLTWIPQAGSIPQGNGNPGGANSQVQFNNAGSFGGDAGFTYNKNTNTLTVDNLNVVANLGSSGSSNLNLTNSLIAAGNVTGAYIIGNGVELSSITGANVTGTVANANYAAYAGNITIANQPNITNVGALTGLSVVGTTKIQQAKEKVSINANALSGVTNYDALNQSILYYTSNITGNITLNVRGDANTTFSNTVSTGESMTLVLMTTVGGTVFVPTQLNVDGVSVTPKWISNVIPNTSTVLANTTVGYSYTFIKTNTSTYTVLASFTGFK